MMRLCVVIVNYRKPGLTLDCLKSIEPELADIPGLHVVVVDNASGDDSLDVLNQARLANGWESWLTIIPSPVNGGFAAGNNVGIRAVEADAYMLLNNDTIVQRGAFALMLETLGADPETGMVGPRILDPDGTPHVSCFRNRTPVSEMLGAARTGPLTRIFRRFDVPLPIADEFCQPEWVGFACVLIRRGVFERIGLLDERYFMYFEDIDFCIRARAAGWRIWHDPRPRVIHLEGGSSDVIASFQGRKRVAKFYYESRARYFATHYGGRPGLWLANLLWMLGRGVSLVREIGGAKKPHTAAHEGRDNWTNWLLPLGTPTLRVGRIPPLPWREAPVDGRPLVGVVAIGRNEGERLRRCLESALRDTARVVYVDSGSSDGSVAMARSLGVEVVELDVSRPFTAARARNAGFDRLLSAWPEVQFVQFVDGDCEIVDGWISAAVAYATSKPAAAVVCGQRRERYPDSSIYNRLCDLEWDTPVGETRACGGDALMRVRAFQAAGGFNPSVIAGEEPELCVRVRQRGWTVHRIDHEMTLHDAQMHRLSQWWKRAMRAGHAYAEGAAMHGARPERHWVREVRSGWFWGLLMWLVALVAAPFTFGLSLLLLLGYVVLYWRVYQWGMRRGWPRKSARLYALFTTIGKLPQCLGMMKYRWNRLRCKQSRIMEYKAASATLVPHDAAPAERMDVVSEKDQVAEASRVH